LKNAHYEHLKGDSMSSFGTILGLLEDLSPEEAAVAGEVLGASYLVGDDEYYDPDDEVLLGEDILLGEDELGASRGRAALMRKIRRGGVASPRGRSRRVPGWLAARVPRARRAVNAHIEAMEMKASQEAAAQAKMEKLALAKAAGATVVEASKPTNSQEWSIGFDSVVNLAAGVATPIAVQPLVLFRANRLAVDESVADAFLITDVRVGNIPQFPNPAAQACSNFRSTARTPDLKWTDCQPSVPITITVQNRTAAPERFMASLFGTAVW
jgi:hypothetical protein